MMNIITITTTTTFITTTFFLHVLFLSLTISMKNDLNKMKWQKYER